MGKNKHAVMLGRRNKGRKKNLSEAERERLRNNMRMVQRKFRWKGKGLTSSEAGGKVGA